MNLIQSKMNLASRVAVVTGGTGYIGQTIANTLAELGADLILVDRADKPEFRTQVEQTFSVQCKFLAADLESADERASLISSLKERAAPPSILVNNAAFVGDSKLTGWSTPFDKQSTETWRRALEVNLTAVFELSRELAPTLGQNGQGSIVNIASIYGVVAPDYSLYEGTSMANPAAYAASKGGLLQLTRWLSTTLAPNTRVNAISPGGVFRNQPEAFVERYCQKTPLGRMATEEDFAGSIAYLCSDLSAYVTGQNIMVDGGWSAW